MPTPLEDVLAGRDERVYVQGLLLNVDGQVTSPRERFICQISLNIPGYPKRLPLDEETVRKGAEDFLLGYGADPIKERFLTNGAGLCWLGLFDGDAETAKRAKRSAVRIEEQNPAGRIFDIDIITDDGSISRNILGLSPRRCLLCGAEAKICARLRAHPEEELRSAVAAQLSVYIGHVFDPE